jgi:hypothetical protein
MAPVLEERQELPSLPILELLLGSWAYSPTASGGWHSNFVLVPRSSPFTGLISRLIGEVESSSPRSALILHRGLGKTVGNRLPQNANSAQERTRFRSFKGREYRERA